MKKLLTLGAIATIAGVTVYLTQSPTKQDAIRVNIEVDTNGTSSTEQVKFAISQGELPTWGIGYGHVGTPHFDSTDRFDLIANQNLVGRPAIVMWYTRRFDTVKFKEDGWIPVGSGWLAITHDYTEADSFLYANGTIVIARPLSDTAFRQSIVAGDLTGDGRTNVVDVSWLVGKLFRGAR